MESILILTPVKNAVEHVQTYVKALLKLSYPPSLISIGFLEGDSDDTTLATFENVARELSGRFRRAQIWKKDFGFRIPPDVPRYAEHLQLERRSVLAKARNHLLFHALDDEKWVLWLDVDVIEYPADIIEKLLAVGKDIVQPHCVLAYGGPTYDTNGWSDQGRVHMDKLRSSEVVPLDSVGGTMLLVRANIHRDGLIFPPFPYGLTHPKIRNDNLWLGEVETEGLGIMADDMGVSCWGLPNLEILHAKGPSRLQAFIRKVFSTI